ncbi:MAG: multiheme c-type cytochrome [Pirellulaceae bacterium]|nr:multiheme c-type cytochrome [Pirellulaceae bacterium]
MLNRLLPMKQGNNQNRSGQPTNAAPANRPPSGLPTPAPAPPPSVNPAVGESPANQNNPKIASNPLADSSLGPRPLLGKEPLPSESSIVVATEAEKNQKVAENWSKPWACLFLTGRQHGYIEPCGCTGLENQKGGLNRRDTLLRSLEERGWDVIPIDTGDQVRRIGRQSEIKFARSAEALKLMNYRAVMYGIEELKLSSTELYLNLTDSSGAFESPFVAANISILEDDKPDRYKIVQVGQRKIAITGIIGDILAKELQNPDVTITPAAQSLKKVASAIQAEKCDFNILIAHTTLEDSRELAQLAPIFDLVITSGGFGEPLYKPEPIPNTKAVMLQVGVKGMYAGVVGLYDNAAEPIKYQRLALSSQFEDSTRMMELFARYQKELEQSGLADLGLRPFLHSSTREFVGTEKCGECHTTAFEKWEQTPHAHATDSIVSPPGRGDVARHFDPECISCHVTGWNPQGFYPYTSGYLSLEKTPQMVGSGCENCHGPGAQHAAAESGDIEVSKEMLVKLREEMRLPLTAAKDKCLECHDIDNSPSFHEEGGFEKFWAQVEHIGKD